MFAVFSKELRLLFLSPLAWSLMAAMQLVLAWIFLVQMEQFLQIQPKLAGMEAAPGVTALVVAPLLDSAAVVIMLLVPLLTMGAISRETSQGTVDLLFSSPVSMTAVIMGKYLAVLTLVAILIVMIALMPFSLLLGTRPDIGLLAAALFGLLLVGAAVSALGICFSGMTEQPAVAAVLSYALLLLLWIIDLSGSGESGSLWQQLSLSSHFRRMLSGLVSTADIGYFCLLTMAALLVGIHRLEHIRSQG